MNKSYRPDIDGLRALAVLPVVLFHVDEEMVPGGFVGVDIFFVISGYLITALLLSEMEEQKFSFAEFYKRRAARLLPALSITLLMVLFFGFFFYGSQQFDSLGKDIFFSAFGAANLHFAQGVNYFAQESAYQPLIHLWSLGVEEQFYVIWPVVMLAVYRFAKSLLLPITILLFVLSLQLSVHGTSQDYLAGYFLPQYRAFELLTGCFLAILFGKMYFLGISERYKVILGWTGASCVLLPMFLLDKSSSFPGYNALLVCIGAGLIVSFPSDRKYSFTRILSYKALVAIGLISYPLYLFHQPILSFLAFSGQDYPLVVVIFVVFTISILMSWMTYRYVELPIRSSVKRGTKTKRRVLIAGLVSTIPIFAASGYIVATSSGLPERFKLLNPYALEVANAHSATFHRHYRRGFVVSENSNARVLFVGDSVLQQYAFPILKALGIDRAQADFVTRGGCVLLKGVDFRDQFSDISCDDLRDRLYSLDKKYDVVFLSQEWDGYGNSIKNFPDGVSGIDRWKPFLSNTVSYFKTYASEVVVVGGHVKVSGASGIQPSIYIDPESMKDQLRRLKLGNHESLINAKSFFSEFSGQHSVRVINPHDIFCGGGGCKLTDGTWSYFSDSQHISSASSDFVINRLKIILLEARITIGI